MENSIKQIVKKVTDSYSKIYEKLNENGLDFFSLSEEIEETTRAIGIDMYKEILKTLDEEIKNSAERKRNYHIQRRADKRELVTKLGLLTYERTYYKSKEEKKYIYLLDELLGINKYERIDPHCKATLIERSAEYSYLKAAKMTTSISISKQSVKNAIREIGKIQNNALEIKKEEKQKEVKNLYIEADEDHISTIDGTNKIMKLVYIYDGVKTQSKDRRKLLGTRYLTGDITAEELWQEVAEYTYEAYNYDKIENIYIAGDGAKWIKTGLKYLPRSKFILDHYHLNKYVKKITAKEPLVTKYLWKAIENKNEEEVIKLIEEVEKNITEEHKGAIKIAKEYIKNNWEGIKNLFGTEKYRCSTEGHISHILSSRLSSRPLAWSMIGADQIARMRVYKANGGSIAKYYHKKRKQEKEEKQKTIKIHKKTIEKLSRKPKEYFGSYNPDNSIEIPHITAVDFKWLKMMLRHKTL